MNHFNTKQNLTPQTMETLNNLPIVTYKENSNIYSGIKNKYQAIRRIDNFSETNKNQEDSRQILLSNRSQINIRQGYILRLLGNQQNQQIRSLKQQNVIVFIFDWDDTLLSTSFISSNKTNNIEAQYKQIFNQIDSLCFKVIKSALQKGIIFIISNSSYNWLTYSSKKYLPKTNQIIWKNQSIRIISARDLFQQKFPQNVLKWKVESFKIIKNHISLSTITNMICVGDSQDQMIASELLAKDFKQIYLKKIKLQPRPTPQQLLKQLQTLDRKFQDVYSAVISTSIKLAKKVLSLQKKGWNYKNIANKKWLCKQC